LVATEKGIHVDKDDKGTGEISRREALKKGMKTGAYVAPVILSASVAGGVSAQTLVMVSRPPAPPPPTAPTTPRRIQVITQFVSLSPTGRTINFAIQLDNLVVDPVTGQFVMTPPLYDVLISDTITRSGSGTIGQLTFAGFSGSDPNIQDNGNGTFTVKLLATTKGSTDTPLAVKVTAQLNTSLNPGETVMNTVTAISASVDAGGPSAPFAAPAPASTGNFPAILGR